MNTFGTVFRTTLIGSSHGNLVGVIIEGIPPNLEIDISNIETFLARRAPGQSKVTTRRKEKDKLIVEAGLFKQRTTGEPFVAFVRNSDVDSSYYEEIKDTPRPGHADYPAFVKFEGANDYRGGGRFSGRMTIGLVIAGTIAKQLLKQVGIDVRAYTKEIAGLESEVINTTEDYIYSEQNIVRVPDNEMIESVTNAIMKARKDGDSVGGIVECTINNLPVGVGEPIFDSIESKLSHIMFSIPAVKGVEFGSGFNAARMKGSEHNDEYFYNESQQIRTKTNNAGGILGGISNGMPVVFRVAFKPTSSIPKIQTTVNLQEKGKLESLKVRGRHDPCIVPRAVPVVECCAAIAIYDLMLQGGITTHAD